MATEDHKAAIAALREKVAALKVAGLEAKNAAVAEAAAAKASFAAQTAAASAAKASAAAITAQAKAQQDAAKAQIQGMAAMSRMLNEKHVADAKAQLLAAKAASEQQKLAAAQEKHAAAQAKAAKNSAAHAKESAAAQDDLAAKSDKLIGKRKALQDAVGGPLGNALSAAQQLGGPLGDIAGKVSNIASLFGRVPPQVAIGLIVVVALTAAITGTVAALYKMGEAAIDVVSKLSMMRSVLGAIHGAAAGNGITGLVDKLSRDLPFASDQIAGWAKSLSFVARDGKQLESMIRSVAAAQALMGESGAAAAQQMIETLGRGGAAASALVAKLKSGTPEAREELNRLGLKTVDLANALGMTEAQFKRSRLSADQMNEAIQKALAKKGAGPLAEMALTWPVIIQKAKEGFLSLFDKLGPAVKPFMAAVKSLFGEFSKGGGAINALKPIVTAVMTTLFGWATKAVNALHAVVTALTSSGKAGGVLSGALTVLRAGWAVVIGILQVAWSRLSFIATILGAIFKNAQVMSGIKVIFTVIAAVVMMAVTAFAALVTGVLTVVGVIGGALAAAAELVVGGIGSIVDAITAGLGMLDPSAFVEKMAGMARAGLQAFKSVLGIASPAKVLVEHGDEDIAGGAAIGVDKGTQSKIKPAAKRMGDALSPDGDGEGAGGRGKGGVYIDLRGSTFNGTDEGLIRRVLLKVWEELAGEAGAQPEGATT